jgi:hypothetical protein
VDEGSVIATAELTTVAAPIIDVQDNGLDFYNRIRACDNAQTVEALSKQPLAGRQQHETSLIVIPEHRSGADDRQAIEEMMNSAGDRRTVRIFVQDELVVRTDFGALGDDIAITDLCDVMQTTVTSASSTTELNNETSGAIRASIRV